MTSIDFSAAQQRVLDRRKARIAAQQSKAHARSSAHALNASNNLPYPLNSLARTGIETWDTIKGREGTRPAFRVGQLDAELLDEELLELLKSQVGEALKYFGSHLRDEWSSEILLGLRLVLFKLSIWDHDASYGAVLQNLRYVDARHTGPLPRTPSRWQKAAYGILSVGGRYGYEKWNTWLADQEGSYEGVSRAVDGANMTKSIPADAEYKNRVTDIIPSLNYLFDCCILILPRISRQRSSPNVVGPHFTPSINLSLETLQSTGQL